MNALGPTEWIAIAAITVPIVVWAARAELLWRQGITARISALEKNEEHRAETIRLWTEHVDERIDHMHEDLKSRLDDLSRRIR